MALLELGGSLATKYMDPLGLGANCEADILSVRSLYVICLSTRGLAERLPIWFVRQNQGGHTRQHHIPRHSYCWVHPFILNGKAYDFDGGQILKTFELKPSRDDVLNRLFRLKSPLQSANYVQG